MNSQVRVGYDAAGGDAGGTADTSHGVGAKPGGDDEDSRAYVGSKTSDAAGSSYETAGTTKDTEHNVYTLDRRKYYC